MPRMHHAPIFSASVAFVVLKHYWLSVTDRSQSYVKLPLSITHT